MKRLWFVLTLLLTGCSTAPVADFLDFFFPGRLTPGSQLQQTGGVCLPQGRTPGSPSVPVVPPPQLPPGSAPGDMLPPPGVPGPGVVPQPPPGPAPNQGNPIIPPPTTGAATRLPRGKQPVPFP